MISGSAITVFLWVAVVEFFAVVVGRPQSGYWQIRIKGCRLNQL
jgi:hypothetical protein